MYGVLITNVLTTNLYHVTGVAKHQNFKVYEQEKPNDTDVDAALKSIKDNDPKLKELNLNNIKVKETHHQCVKLQEFVLP